MADFEAILFFKSLFEGVLRCLKGSYFVWRAKIKYFSHLQAIRDHLNTFLRPLEVACGSLRSLKAKDSCFWPDNNIFNSDLEFASNLFWGIFFNWQNSLKQSQNPTQKLFYDNFWFSVHFGAIWQKCFGAATNHSTDSLTITVKKDWFMRPTLCLWSYLEPR